MERTEKREAKGDETVRRGTVAKNLAPTRNIPHSLTLSLSPLHNPILNLLAFIME